MTVVGLQKNTIDTLSAISGVAGGINNVANSGTKDFLQILTMLADQNILDVEGVEEASLLHIPTNSILDGYKALKLPSQVGIGEDKIEDAINDLKYLMAAKGENIDETIIQILNEEKKPILSDSLQETNSSKNFENNINSLFVNKIRKIERAVDSLKTILDQSESGVLHNQDLLKDLGKKGVNINEHSNKFFDFLYSHSEELKETLNLKILDGSGKHLVPLETSEFESNEDQDFVKFFMKVETDFSDKSSAGEIAKVSIDVGPKYSEVEIITTGSTNKIDKTRLINPVNNDGIAIEIDKGSIQALAISLSRKKSESPNLNLASNATKIPKIAIIFDQFPVSTDSLRSSIKVIPSLNDLDLGISFYTEKSAYDLVGKDISNTGIGKSEPVSNLQLVKAIGAETKFSEFGELELSLDKKQMRNAIEGISSNLALLNAKELKVLSAYNSLSEKIKIFQQQQQLRHATSLVAFKDFNSDAGSSRTALLATTSNVLKYRGEIEKFTTKNIFSETYSSINENDLKNIFSLSNNSTRELIPGEKSLQFSGNAESNASSSNNFQMQAQSSSYISGNYNNSQGQMIYNSSTFIGNSTNTLHVFDAQFNSRLGMLLSESVALGRESFELQLEPENFGKVRVNVSLESASLEVKMVAENTGAVSVLRSAEGLLQSITDQSGLKLAEYSVEMQSGGENNRHSSNNGKQNTDSSNIQSSKTEEKKEDDLNSMNENSDQVLNLIA